MAMFWGLLFSISQLSFASDIVYYQDCKPESDSDAFLYSDDFNWFYTMPEMLAKFDEIYTSGKRLKSRAYYDESSKKIFLPNLESQGGRVIIPISFIETISHHIEEAFKYQYIDAVFFPDMGHSHFFIRNQDWETKYKDIPVGMTNTFYEELFKDTELKILYHTAEQLKTNEKGQLPTDRILQWRYHTRNLVGRNSMESDIKVISEIDSPANTLHDLSGYYYYGAGFNLSASKNGCFEYQVNQKKFRFDLSLFDLSPQQTGDQIIDP